jgi:hypothetical protein
MPIQVFVSLEPKNEFALQRPLFSFHLEIMQPSFTTSSECKNGSAHFNLSEA